MPRLLHLNGPPGIGKSTLARRHVEERPGVLNCDIDVLRMLVGGWQEDRDAAIARFHRRTGEGPLLDHVRDVVARDGGDRFLGMLHDGLMTLARRDGVVVVASVEGDPDGTYDRVLRAVGDRTDVPE